MGSRGLALALVVAGCSTSAADNDSLNNAGVDARRDAGGADKGVVLDPVALDAGPADSGIVTAKPLVDLFAFKMWGAASGSCEVSILSGADNYATFKRKDHPTLPSTPPNGSIEMMTGDLDRDGFTDLYFLGRVATHSGVTEIHVMDGKSTYGKFLTAVPTGFAYTGVDRQWAFRVGDYNGDTTLDLYGILSRATGSGKIEVHVVDGANNLSPFLEHTATALPQVADDAHVPFYGLADANHDGALDLYVITGTGTASGATEVAVLGGAGHFMTVLSRDATPLPPIAADGRTSFAVADANGDGAPDLFVILRAGTSSGMTEVTILSGADHFKTVLRAGPTALGPTANGASGWYFDLAKP